MSDKMDDLFANVKKMVDSGNIPDDIKQMMQNLHGNQSEPNPISPEMLNNLSSMLNSNTQSSNTSNNNFNLDMNTIMKMKSIMESMNNKNDPRANLLYSLKPYLRDSKKEKLDQYVNLLNVSKIAEFMNQNTDNDKKK